jgi:hypothetical protein
MAAYHCGNARSAVQKQTLAAERQGPLAGNVVWSDRHCLPLKTQCSVSSTLPNYEAENTVVLPS